MSFDSLFIGVTGLESYQTQIDVISNNIANVGTTGFKGQTVNFQDLLYQTQSFASASTQTRGGVNGQDIGLGVKVGSIATQFQQGGLNTTGVNTDLAINGDGFFVLRNKDGSGIPTYTRNGAFSLNQDGLLYDPSSGLAVQGYQASANGTITGTGVPQSLQIPLGLKSAAVGTGFGTQNGPTGDKVFDVAFGGNLDQTQYIIAASNAGVGATTTTISTTLYDSLGNAHLVNVAFIPAVTGSTTNHQNLPATVVNAAGVAVTAATEWQYTVSPTDTSTITQNNGYVFFDANGQFINTTAGNGQPNAGLAAGAGHRSNALAKIADGNQITVANWQFGNNATAITTAGGPIGLDFSNVTSLSGASNPPNVLSQNGYPQGTLSNINIGQDGTIQGAFSNGQQQTLGRVALATFQNEQGLHREGSSQFSATANSGLAQVGTAANGRFGAIVSGSLEQSNVSIADEFTKLILAQRSFEANSRSITTADSDLQTVIALKR